MSDITIPGISSGRGMDTSKMVEDLMEVERRPVRRLEENVETYEKQRRTWQDLGRKLSGLRDASRTLFGIDNPFRNRIGEVSDPSVLSVSASRRAGDATEEVTVLQTAGRDRFASNALDRDFRVEPGVYEFSLGDRTRSFRFSGGTVREFAEQVNSRVPDVVRVNVVPDTSTTERLVFIGQGEGAESRLSFGEAAETLANRAGVISPARPDRSVSLLEDSVLRLEPGEEETLRLDQRFPIESGMVLQFEARTEEHPREEWEPPPAPPGAEIPEPGSVTLQGVTVHDETFELDLPDHTPPEPPEVVEDNRAITLSGAGERRELPAVPETEQFETITVRADQLTPEAEAFSIANRNTHRSLEVRNIRILDPDARDGAVPANAIETARDARIRYSGIEITRSSNEIDDLIPGATLNLRRSSPEPVQIDIRPDTESAKDAIISFVGHYNQVVRDINIYTRRDRSVIDQIDYFEDAERELMESRLGLFQGETTLNQLRSGIQNIMMNSYGGADDQVQLLAQVGISSNVSGGGALDMSRMRGYMEIDERTLDDALENRFDAVARVFGHDSTGDLIMDRGAAVAMERYLTPYVQTGGVIAGRSSGLETRISQTETRIDRYNDRLETTEQRLRREFGRMEGALNQLEEQSQALDNLPGIGGQSNR